MRALIQEVVASLYIYVVLGGSLAYFLYNEDIINFKKKGFCDWFLIVILFPYFIYFKSQELHIDNR